MPFVRFDADMARVKEEGNRERILKDKAIREKGLFTTERLQLESQIEVGQHSEPFRVSDTVYICVYLCIMCIMCISVYICV